MILLEWIVAAVVIFLFIRLVLMPILADLFPTLQSSVGKVRDEKVEVLTQLQAEEERKAVEELRQKLTELTKTQGDSNNHGV